MISFLYIYANEINMRDLYPLKKKLLGYSTISAGVLALAAEKSNAQIVYTDVNPDIVSTEEDNIDYLLDLNNDGIIDFKINAHKNYEPYYGGYTEFWVSVKAYNLNAVGTSHPPFGWDLALPLNGADVIDANLDWYSPFGSILMAGYFDDNNSTGLWYGKVNKFLPLKLEIASNVYYGWARMDVFSGYKKIYKLRDYACNSVAGEPIVAGQTDNCTDLYEPNNSNSEATIIQPNQSYKGLINPQGDNDWYGFHVTNQEPNIQITLFNLPKNYNIQLYDVNGNKIGQSVNSGGIPDTIIFNGLLSGSYFVKVLPKGNSHSTNFCYSLKIETNSSPWKIESISGNSLFDQWKFDLYPNPALDQLHISFLDDQIVSTAFTIFNLMGQQVIEQKEVIVDGNSDAIIDVSNLSDGEYLLHIRFETGIEVKKFIVRK